ncbi:hypothetical protein BGZ80_005843 [Entomortierella chlamydospora]|uniref:Uncharacterized protein n=1 Tax=Entomortierella chlamydospora TaxID=101097 RepID=A0A9P6T241_9FUNG|nr:hypothetical protein BGZ79_007922 [Entomortierella chlamydospora]KAG0019418.1 hypothetical protein BGZ80_005843 [Entomortierella chlamydospora]
MPDDISGRDGSVVDHSDDKEDVKKDDQEDDENEDDEASSSSEFTQPSASAPSDKTISTDAGTSPNPATYLDSSWNGGDDGSDGHEDTEEEENEDDNVEDENVERDEESGVDEDEGVEDEENNFEEVPDDVETGSAILHKRSKSLQHTR